MFAVDRQRHAVDQALAALDQIDRSGERGRTAFDDLANHRRLRWLIRIVATDGLLVPFFRIDKAQAITDGDANIAHVAAIALKHGKDSYTSCG